MQSPEYPPQLYEFEGCPFCARARKSLRTLAVDVLIKPCPKGGTRFRPEAEQLGGKAQFPFLVDLNTETRLYESDAIVEYLQREYGAEQAPQKCGVGLADMIGIGLAHLVSGGDGAHGDHSSGPEQPLEFFAIDTLSDSGAVRRELSKLELPYMRRTVADAGQTAVENSELLEPPCMKDPNTDTLIRDSAEILAYIKRTYGS